MKRFGDLIGAAALVAVTGYMTIRLIQEINKVVQPVNTAAQPFDWVEPEVMDGPASPDGWRAIDPTEFALPDEFREQTTVLRPGESLLPWLDDSNV